MYGQYPATSRAGSCRLQIALDFFRAETGSPESRSGCRGSRPPDRAHGGVVLLEATYCAEQLEEIANHLHRLLRQYGVSRSTTQPPGGLTNAQPPNTQSGLAYDDDIFVQRLATQALKAPP